MSKFNNFFRELGIGYKSYFKAFTFVLQHKMVRYFLIPLLLNILLFWGGLELFFELAGFATAKFREWINFEENVFWNDFFYWLISGLIYVSFFLIFVFLSGYVILIVLSPLLAIISEKVDKIISKNDFPFSFSQLMKDIKRGTLIALRNTFIEILFMILMLIISFIPVIGWVSPIVLFIVSSYFYGFSYMDYTNERRKKSVKESVSYIRRHKGIAVANGSVFSVLLLIPFCGASIAAFVSIISVVAATLSIIEAEKPGVKNE